MVDGGLFDDAAIYKVNDHLALVQTLDFFTPIVDTPRIFGEIAAANALSDVYAMGGDPKTAMAILAFPLATMDSSVIVDVLQGASDKMKEAGVNFVGGHSIDDDTLKFGLSVTGYVNPKNIWSNANAKAGDILILTKPLGTGTSMAGLKRQEYSEDDLTDVLASMSSLNRVLDLLSLDEVSAIHSATDITGFGLLGHSQQMAKASRVSFEFNFSKLPVFEIAWKSLKNNFLTKAHRTNAEYTAAMSQIEIEDPIKKMILFDPQTSGGLLLSVNSAYAESVLASLQKRFHRAVMIGKVLPQKDKWIVVKSS
jgi:selenide,water dikinase